MEKLLKPNHLPWVAIGAGTLGFVLQVVFLSSGSNGAGMLPGNHPVFVALWVLTVLVGILLVLGSRDLKQAPRYSFNFPPSVMGAAGAAVGAVGVLISVIVNISGISHTLVLLDVVLGILSAGALLFLSRCRLKGLHPSILFHAVICIYLMVDLICVYRLRSSDPQIQKYCFSLLASVSIMLASYYNAAFAANAGDRQKHTISHLFTVFFCVMGLPWSENPVFYLTMGFWMYADLCNLTPIPQSKR